LRALAAKQPVISTSSGRQIIDMGRTRFIF
jgi:hypothetical protein